MCELPSVYQHDTPVARKNHTCLSCHGVISKGEQYHNHHGVWDGQGCTFKICTDCEMLRREIDADTLDPEERTGFDEVCDAVFNADDAVWIKRFLDIKRKRGAAIMDWMLKREADRQKQT